MATKLKIILLMIILLGCSETRKDIVFEAFTDPFMDWCSLNLYSNGNFDLHIPSIDYRGRYKVSGDTILLRSIETEPRTMTTTVNGEKIKEIIKEQQWTFLIDSEGKKIRTIGNEASVEIWIDIVKDEL